MMQARDTITLYSVFVTRGQDGQETEQRRITILRGVLLQANTAAYLRRTGLESGQTSTLRRTWLESSSSATVFIPSSARAEDAQSGQALRYLPQRAFHQANAPADCWTILLPGGGSESYFTLGIPAEPAASAAQLRRSQDGLWQACGVTDYRGAGGVGHLCLEGK